MAYTTIDDPSAHFQTGLLTGNAGLISLTNDGNSDLQPDFIWHKQRNGTQPHTMRDTSRGINKFLYTALNNAEGTNSYFTSFNTDGYTINSSDNEVNGDGDTYVSWQWKANGGTTSSNTSGSITSTVQANTTAGFSIVSYVGAGASTVSTIGHSLGAVPDMMIVKSRTDTESWMVYHQSMGNGKKLYLDLTLAAASTSQWNNTTPTSTLFTTTGDATNDSGDNVIAYCFKSIQGYSKFGGYTGNGNNNDGVFLYLGFKPAYVMVKATDVDEWRIYDHKRANAYNVINVRLKAEVNNAESQDDNECDFLSNGIKWRSSSGGVNSSGQAYTYMAFAEQPFVTSTGIPATAR